MRKYGQGCPICWSYTINYHRMITDLPLRCIQSSYEQFKKLFSNNGQRQLDTPMRLAAGGLAGMCSVVSTYPLDLVRSRISIVTASIGSAQLQAAGGGQAIPLPKEISILGMTSKVFREEGGVRGLYRGVSTSYLGLRGRSGPANRAKLMKTRPIDRAHVGGRHSICGRKFLYEIDFLLSANSATYHCFSRFLRYPEGLLLRT